VQFNTYLENNLQLEQIKETSIREVILEHVLLSRIGRNDTKSLLFLVEKALSYNMSPVLQWDILCTENIFQKCLKILEQIPLSMFHAIRVQDLGVAEWIRKEYPDLPLHLIIESGNHNLKGMESWSKYFGKQLNRLVLSNEIPKTKLIEYAQILDTPCEILCVGRILLFYSPRKLLSKYNFSHTSLKSVEKNLMVADKPQRIFPAIENQHGTFMFHHRDLFLIDHIPDLMKSNLGILRLDLRHLDFSCNWFKKINEIIRSFDKKKVIELKSTWPVKITKGFFRANRTDLAIDRIKNPHLKDHGENLVGYVVESIKEEHIILLARKTFSCGKPLLAITPEGRECIISTKNIKTTGGIPVGKIVSENLYQVPHVKYVTAQTLIYKQSET